MPQPIDSSLFVAKGPGVRSFVREIDIDAPVARVFRAWSDGDAFRRAYDPERPELSANIDLAIGGRYEWLWDGEIGSNGCQVLSFIPDRMLSFSWNSPPSQAETRVKRTWVVVEFEQLDGQSTHVRVTHLGFGEGPAWDETLAYFQEAWSLVLNTFRTHLGQS